MSCYQYLNCIDHDPPLRAEGESGQHTYDIPRIQELLAMRDTIVQVADTLPFEPESRYDANTIAFIRQHPHCRLRIINELGEDTTDYTDHQ